MTTHQGAALQAAVRRSTVQDGILIAVTAPVIVTAILTTAPTAPHGATEAGGESSTFLASLEQE